MCRNNVKASDKTGKATLKGCIADARALEKCTILMKIGRRIELQNPNRRENQAEIGKDMTHNTRTPNTAKFGKRDKGGKASRTLLQRSSIHLPSHLLVVNICNSYYKRDWKYYNKNEKEKYPPLHFFSKKWVLCVSVFDVTSMKNKGESMKKKEKGAVCYFRLKPKLLKKFETSVGRRGYPSRSKYFTDVVLVTIGEPEEGENTLPKHVKEWIDKNKPPLTEDEIKTSLEETIRTMLFPVIALRGADISHESAWKNIRSRFREEHGMWLTESDIREAIEEFASVHHGELIDYRNNVLEGEQL